MDGLISEGDQAWLASLNHTLLWQRLHYCTHSLNQKTPASQTHWYMPPLHLQTCEQWPDHTATCSFSRQHHRCLHNNMKGLYRFWAHLVQQHLEECWSEVMLPKVRITCFLLWTISAILPFHIHCLILQHSTVCCVDYCTVQVFIHWTLYPPTSVVIHTLCLTWGETFTYHSLYSCLLCSYSISYIHRYYKYISCHPHFIHTSCPSGYRNSWVKAR